MRTGDLRIRRRGIAAMLFLLLALAGCGGASPPSLGSTRARATDGMTMVFVPPGEFLMGSDSAGLAFAQQMCRKYSESSAVALATCQSSAFSDEQPAHPVALDAFWIDRTEVTNGQYQRCVESAGCTPPAEPGSYSRAAYYGEPAFTGYPVVWVTRDQAAGYCAWAGARLPTEAEWEYAARGPENRLFPWGDIFDGTRLNFCDARCTGGPNDRGVDDGYSDTAPVGAYPAGASWNGALDLAGNVREWVADWYGRYPRERQENPSGPARGDSRIPRGGSWLDTPDDVRSANRGANAADYTRHKVGFRCASAPVRRESKANSTERGGSAMDLDKDALSRDQRALRPFSFVLYVIGGFLIFLFGSNYHNTFPTNKNAAYEAGLTLLLLILVLLLHRAPRSRPYAKLAFALFVASFANAALLAFGHVLDPLLPIAASDAQTIALDKVAQALPIVISIMLLTKLTGGDWGTIFVKRGSLRQGLMFGLISFGVFATIFTVILLLQADAPATTGLTATGIRLSTIVAAIPWILLFIFTNSFMEELWFRGISLRKLAPALGTRATVIATALVFGSVHLGASYVNPSEQILFFAIVTVLGLVNGYVMLKTDSIWGSFLFHAGYDLLVILPILMTM